MPAKTQPDAATTAWTADDLRAWRKSMGWTQTQAAEALGVTLRGYQHREGGTVPVLRETMLACLYLADRASPTE